MCDNCYFLGGKHHPDCYHNLTPLVDEPKPEPIDLINKAKADAWNECIGWFALLGPLNGNQRINMNILLEAEEANPYERY